MPRFDEHDIKMMGDTEFNRLASIVNAEQDKRGFLRGCKAEVDKRIDTYMEYAPTEAKDLKALADGATIGPGEIVKSGNDYYKNVSRAWLDPFKAGPVNFIAGWEKQDGGVL